MKPPFRLFLLFLALCLSAAQVSSQKVAIANKPAWVTSLDYDAAETFGEKDAEYGYLNLAFEKQIAVAPYTTYIRKVTRVLTEAGVERISKVSVNYDPTYQQLAFHSIRLLRDNKIINQLTQSKIKIIQQEKDIDRNLYDGSLTAMVILDDLRKGDVVEYSYSIKGANPVFNGKFSETFDLNFSIPIANIYYKLVAPTDRPFTIRNMGDKTEPTVSRSASQDVYEWKLSKVPALRSQDWLPGWYSPYSYVLISEFKSWKDVNDWALQLFPEQKLLSAPLQARIDEIKASHHALEDQVVAALRFVQDEVRYMGIEVGANSHQPANPNKIFSQRYGDCKDKTYLLCTMLKALGVQAFPVLINTYNKKDIANWLPAADAFDHATVMAVVNGRNYWFDPTITYQRGGLDMISFPDYQVGLVVSPGTTGLTTISNREPGTVDVRETFDVKDTKGEAKLVVISRYSGTFADEVRSRFHEASRYEILKTYSEYYSSFYDDIRADSLDYSEEDSTGTLIVREYYTIENIWKKKDGVDKAIFSPYIILGLLKRPDDKKRKMPFAIAYPLRYKEHVIIKTPLEWNVEPNRDYIDIDPFKMKAAFDAQPGRIDLTYEYESLQDHVTPEQMPEYINALDKVENTFSFHLTDFANKDAMNNIAIKRTRSNTRSIAVFVIGLLSFGGILWFMTRRR